jgi:hypothetical protein
MGGSPLELASAWIRLQITQNAKTDAIEREQLHAPSRDAAAHHVRASLKGCACGCAAGI